MAVVMTIGELERLLAAEFPQAFHSESGLAIEAVWDAAAGCGRRSARPRCGRAARFPVPP